MRKKNKKSYMLWLFIFLLIALINSVYFFNLRPLQAQCDDLKTQIAQAEDTLDQLYKLKALEPQMDAEYVEAQLELERYQAFVYEYGTYPQLIMLLADIEKRLDVDISSIGLGESSFNISMEATYDTLKDFLHELEAIDYLYTCQGLSFSPIADDATDEDSEDKLNVLLDNSLHDDLAYQRDNMPVSVTLTASFIEQPVKSLNMTQINALIGARVFGKENVFKSWP